MSRPWPDSQVGRTVRRPTFEEAATCARFVALKSDVVEADVPLVRKPVFVGLLALVSLLLLPAAGSGRVRDNGTLWVFSGDDGRYDLYRFVELRKDPVGDRLFDGWRMVDPDTGIETVLPLRSESAFDGDRLVGCDYGRMVVFDVATDTIVYDLGSDELPTPWFYGCDIRDGKVYAGHDDGVLVVDLSDLSTSVLTFPGHSKLTVLPQVGSDDNILHVKSVWDFYDIDLADPTAMTGPRAKRLQVTAHTNSTFDTEGTNIVEYDREGATIRTWPCPWEYGCNASDVYPLDSDRVFVTGTRNLRLVDLATDEVLAEVATSSTERINLVDAEYLYMSHDSDVIRIDLDASHITDAPDLVDLRTSTIQFFQTWSLFEPVAVTANGLAVPFTRASGGVDVDLSGLGSGPAAVSVTFANGRTTPPATFDVIGLPTWKTVSVTAHDEPGASHDAAITMQCSGVYAQAETKVISSGQTISFEVPESAPCEATAAGGRFGPLHSGGFVIDYSTTWPDPDLDPPGDDWHLWVGADNVHPVHWVILDKSAGSIAERPATIHCGVQLAWQGNLEYGRLYRFLRDFTPIGGANSCQWSAELLPGFDGTQIESFGPVTRTPHVYFGDSSTLTFISDYLIHPDTSPEAFLNAMNRRANGRVSTPGELNWWVPRIADNAGFRGLAVDAIIRSEEYRSRTEAIARLYQAYFDRLPDASGLAYWTDVAARGTSPLDISDYFAQSTEFRRKFGDADNGRFVLLAYENVLSRPPDAAGYDYWLTIMDDGVLDGPGVLFYFSDSTEFRAVMRDRLAVTGTYTLVVHRAPSEAELRAGIESFRATGSLAELANTLFHTPEYAHSFAAYLRP